MGFDSRSWDIYNYLQIIRIFPTRSCTELKAKYEGTKEDSFLRTWFLFITQKCLVLKIVDSSKLKFIFDLSKLSSNRTSSSN